VKGKLEKHEIRLKVCQKSLKLLHEHFCFSSIQNKVKKSLENNFYVIWQHHPNAITVEQRRQILKIFSCSLQPKSLS